MVSSKKVHCAFCRKKCTGNVLRYQDQYYHKQCFELEQQSESSLAANLASNDDGGGGGGELQQLSAAAGQQRAAQVAGGRTTGEVAQAAARRLELYADESAAAAAAAAAHPHHQRSPLMRNESAIDSSLPSPSSMAQHVQHCSEQERQENLPEVATSGVGRSQFVANNTASSPSWRRRFGQNDASNDAMPSTANQTRIFTSHATAGNGHHQQQQQHHQDHFISHAAVDSSNSLASVSGQSRASSRQNIASPASAMAQSQGGGANNRPLTSQQLNRAPAQQAGRAATLPHSISSPSNGFLASDNQSTTTTANSQTTTTPTTHASNSKHLSRTLDNRQSAINGNSANYRPPTTCAGCRERIVDGQALIALDLHWHVWCFKCAQCKSPLHGEYVAKDGRAYCEKDYQKLFGITCVYCKRYITGKVLQAGEAHHFHPSCARCSKCGDPFVPGEEMYLQGEVTWHPRCGPGPSAAAAAAVGRAESSLMDADSRGSQLRASRAQSPSLSSRSRSRSASPFSYMSRQYGRSSPAYAESEAVGDLSRIYTISYLNSDPNQGYLRRPIEPMAPKSPQFSRPTSLSRLGGAAASDRSRCSSRSQQYALYGSSSNNNAAFPTSGSGGGYAMSRDRSVPRGMYSVLSGMGRSHAGGGGGSSLRARSPSMMNEEAIQLAAYPSGQKPPPDSVPKIERDDFPAPPFPYPNQAAGGARHSSKSAAATSQTNGASSAHLDESPVVRKSHQAGQQQQQERVSRPRSREITADQLAAAAAGTAAERSDSMSSNELDPQFRKEEEELSKIANGIGKIFLQTLKEREKLRAWKRANLDPRNASRTPSATRELPSRLRYENATNASPSRDMDRPRPRWEEDELLSGGEHSPTRTRSSLGKSAAAAAAATLSGQATPASATTAGPPQSAISSSYGYKVVQANRSTPRPGYGVTSGGGVGVYQIGSATPSELLLQHLSFAEQQRIAQARANDLLGRQQGSSTLNGHGGGGGGGGYGHGPGSTLQSEFGTTKLPNLTSSGSMRSLASAAHLRRSMPNVANLHHLHQEGGPPKLYPYHLLATSNYRLPPEVDRCHLERHLSNEEFQYIFHCDRLDFYRLPEWKRNELKRRARLF